ncbi:MAG: hypothetical protein AAF211_12820 [Myxococcota bacterium]
MPAAFLGRRRFDARPPEPEPEPEDPIAKAREWAEAPIFDGDDVYVEEVSEEEPPVVEDVPSEPLSYLKSSGYVVVDDEDAPVDETPELPRLPVAGASVSGSMELPRPRGGDWPTETPPHTDHAVGADGSLTAVSPVRRVLDSTPGFGSFDDPSPGDAALGHTLQPRSPSIVQGSPVEPRPSLAEAGRFPVRDRPEGPRDAPRSPLTQLPVPSPFRKEPEDDVVLDASDEAAAADAEATQHRPVSIPIPQRGRVDHTVAPLDFGLEDYLSSSSSASWTPPPPSMGPSTTTLAALGCLAGFGLLATLGAIGIAVWVVMG